MGHTIVVAELTFTDLKSLKDRLDAKTIDEIIRKLIRVYKAKRGWV